MYSWYILKKNEIFSKNKKLWNVHKFLKARYISKMVSNCTTLTYVEKMLKYRRERRDVEVQEGDFRTSRHTFDDDDIFFLIYV